jgi:agmatinase
LLNAQKKRQRNPVVGFDIVELMDSPMAKPTAFLAAKLYYKMLAYYHLAEKQTFIKSN